MSAHVGVDLFSYDAYCSFLDGIKQEGYKFCGYDNWRGEKKLIIMRHDIDYSLEDAIPIAEIEANAGVKSTYFVLVRGDCYNIFSRKGMHALRLLKSMGHEIGLHFDEVACEAGDHVEGILQEARLLGAAAETEIKSVSMHRPSREALEGDWSIPGMENAYSQEYFRRFKYISDSRMRWRENAGEIIRSGRFDQLQVLTHPFWYGERSLDLPHILNGFIARAQYERVIALDDNFTRLGEEIGFEKVRIAKVAVGMRGKAFETERLVLRPFRMADASDMFEYASDSEVCRFLNWGPYADPNQALDWINAKLNRQNPSDILLGIEEKTLRKLIGAVRIYHIDDPAGTAEISYVLNSRYQGRGYMTEAVSRLIDLCFEDLGISRVVAYCARENKNSLDLMLRVGMHVDDSYRGAVEVKGATYEAFRCYVEKGDA